MHWFNPELATSIAIETSTRTISYKTLCEKINTWTDWIQQQQLQRIAIAFDNEVEWIVLDLACQKAKVCCIPIPLFFSKQQRQHLLDESQSEVLISFGQDSTLSNEIQTPEHHVSAHLLNQTKTVVMPKETNKITFTSGSTGTPKGVCLSTQSQWNVAQSLVNKLALPKVRHLCLLPLSTLLENIAGVFAPLLQGGSVILANENERGFSGSRLISPNAMVELISKTAPTSIILVPELLMVLLNACQQSWVPPTSLKYIAVGGAHVAPKLIDKAHAMGLPVHQGYGLSEAVSVSTLNLPNDGEHASNKINSAGKPLGHNRIHIVNNEVVITGNIFLGYLNQPDSFHPKSVYTGDLGYFKNDHLILEGRKKNLIINAFGRNISPEWIEQELMASGLFLQVVVCGDARPFCCALLVPAMPSLNQETLASTLAAINNNLPDYAQIGAYAMVSPFSVENGLLTETGKIKRQQIIHKYADVINSFYQKPNKVNGE